MLATSIQSGRMASWWAQRLDGGCYWSLIKRWWSKARSGQCGGSTFLLHVAETIPRVVRRCYLVVPEGPRCRAWGVIFVLQRNYALMQGRLIMFRDVMESYSDIRSWWEKSSSKSKDLNRTSRLQDVWTVVTSWTDESCLSKAVVVNFLSTVTPWASPLPPKKTLITPSLF